MRTPPLALAALALLWAACDSDDDGNTPADAAATGDAVADAADSAADPPAELAGDPPTGSDTLDASHSDGAEAADGPTPDLPPAACPAAELGQRLGRDRLLVGGSMDDTAFTAAPFDLRYVYLAGPVADPPCASCAADCVVEGQSCANAAGGCGWWGCWQYDVPPPGRYVADFVDNAESAGAVPMFTYYLWFTEAGRVEGAQEVAALADGNRVRRFLADWRFFAQVVADTTDEPVIAHLEPDLWGYGHQVADDPSTIPVAVSGAGAAECAGLGDHLAGFARCMVAIARAEAPNLLIGYHASAWGAGHDALINADPGFDLLAHADETAAFMRALGAEDTDLLVVEMSDRDAGFNNRWWDASDEALPHFQQARRWASRVAAELGLPYLWWQIPYGHEGLDDSCGRYADNRVAYFFDHAGDFAADGALGIAFGAGAECMTTPATDEGFFTDRASAYYASERPCLCGECP